MSNLTLSSSHSLSHLPEIELANFLFLLQNFCSHWLIRIPRNINIPTIRHAQTVMLSIWKCFLVPMPIANEVGWQSWCLLLSFPSLLIIGIQVDKIFRYNILISCPSNIYRLGSSLHIHISIYNSYILVFSTHTY